MSSLHFGKLHWTVVHEHDRITPNVPCLHDTSDRLRLRLPVGFDRKYHLRRQLNIRALKCLPDERRVVLAGNCDQNASPGKGVKELLIDSVDLTVPGKIPGDSVYPDLSQDTLPTCIVQISNQPLLWRRVVKQR